MRKELIDSIIEQVHKKNYDTFRDYYDSFSFEELKYFANTSYNHKPQASFNFDAFVELFSRFYNLLHRPVKVVELGPHQGHLASRFLTLYDSYVESWVGYDLSEKALNDSVVKHNKYIPTPLEDYFYNLDLPEADLFCATHMLEHVSRNELDKYLKTFRKYKYLIIELPRIDMIEKSWKGYCGTHVLIISVNDFKKCLNDIGFNLDGELMYFRKWWVTGWLRDEGNFY